VRPSGYLFPVGAFPRGGKGEAKEEQTGERRDYGSAETCGSAPGGAGPEGAKYVWQGGGSVRKKKKGSKSKDIWGLLSLTEGRGGLNPLNEKQVDGPRLGYCTVLRAMGSTPKLEN